MIYDIIDGYGQTEDTTTFFTLRDLMDILENYKEKNVKFVGTEKSIGELISWRGSYDIPCLTPINEVKSAADILQMLKENVNTFMYGYKGGEYMMHENSEFYISSYGMNYCYKMCGWEIENNDFIILTKIDEY